MFQSQLISQALYYNLFVLPSHLFLLRLSVLDHYPSWDFPALSVPHSRCCGSESSTTPSVCVCVFSCLCEQCALCRLSSSRYPQWRGCCLVQVCLATPEVSQLLPGSILQMCLYVSIYKSGILPVLPVYSVYVLPIACLSVLGEGSLLS